MTKINKTSGAASLFLVIFASLLFMTIALSYVTVMLRDQQQATTVNLSQSAYDAAMSGIEDAKVLLSRYYKCKNDNTDTPGCSSVISSIEATTEGNECSSVARGLGYNNSAAYKETLIGTKIGSSIADLSDAASKIDQAYTCNKITLNTAEFKSTLKAEESQVVPLFGTSDFNKVTLSWHQAKDSTAGSPYWPAVIDDANANLLPKKAGEDKFPILRMQYISDREDNKTSFLVPVSGPAAPDAITGKKMDVHCKPSPLGSGDIYHCTMSFNVEDANRALLVLKSPYRETSYSVTLAKDGARVDFSGVQPKVDVTARANDRFRRVEARLQPGGADFKYPEAAMSVKNGICKKFVVTDDPGHFDGKFNCDES